MFWVSRFLIATFLVIPCHSEWRRSVTNFTKGQENLLEEFQASIYYVGNPYVTFDEFWIGVDGNITDRLVKGKQSFVLNESVPILFKDKSYYWNSAYTTGLHVCEYQIGIETGLSYTYVKNPNGQKERIKAIYHECGLIETCEGLLCSPFNWTKVLVAGGILLAVLAAIGLALWAYRSGTRFERKAKEMTRREVEDRELGSKRKTKETKF